MPEHTIERANQLFLAKKFAESITLYDQVLEKTPDNVDALNNKGYALSKLKQHQDAISCYDLALQKHPNEKTILTNKISSLRKLKSYDMALDHCNQILNSEPHNNIILYHKERILSSIGDYSGAIECCDIILNDYPQNAEVLFDKAVAQAKSNQEFLTTLNQSIMSDHKMKLKAKTHSAFANNTTQDFLRTVS